MLRRRKPLRRTRLLRKAPLCRVGRIRKRRGKPRRGRILDPRYLAWVATLPCLICAIRPVEVSHLGLRGLGQKCDDKYAGPLCSCHHQHGPEAHHVLGKRFWAHHKLDRADVFARLHEQYRRETGRDLL